jgi:hypothetical protein
VRKYFFPISFQLESELELELDFAIPFKITRSAHSALARNCPKLLQVTMSQKKNGVDKFVSINSKRLNGDSEFRRMRQPVEMKKSYTELLDYDSVESCSDEEEDFTWSKNYYDRFYCFYGSY